MKGGNTTMDNFGQPNFGTQEPTQSAPAPAPASQITPETQTTSFPTNETTTQTPSQPSRGNDNVVFIGSKPVMNYVTSILMQFTSQDTNEVIVKARGKFISKAVDVVEVTRKRFMDKHSINITSIKTDTEVYEKEGRKINVSTIDIYLKN